jgi:hypothetical protein
MDMKVQADIKTAVVLEVKFFRRLFEQIQPVNNEIKLWNNTFFAEIIG